MRDSPGSSRPSSCWRSPREAGTPRSCTPLASSLCLQNKCIFYHRSTINLNLELEAAPAASSHSLLPRIGAGKVLPNPAPQPTLEYSSSCMVTILLMLRSMASGSGASTPVAFRTIPGSHSFMLGKDEKACAGFNQYHDEQIFVA